MPFGSLGVKPPGIVEQEIPNYAQWDWAGISEKGMKAMEQTFEMTQDAQNQPIAREQAKRKNEEMGLSNALNAATFDTDIKLKTAELNKTNAEIKYYNARADTAAGYYGYSPDFDDSSFVNNYLTGGQPLFGSGLKETAGSGGIKLFGGGN